MENIPYEGLIIFICFVYKSSMAASCIGASAQVRCTRVDDKISIVSILSGSGMPSAFLEHKYRVGVHLAGLGLEILVYFH